MKLTKMNAFKLGYCAHCAAFHNYDRKKEKGPRRFLCGLMVPNGQKHLCFRDRPAGVKLKPGKDYENVEHAFFNSK